MGEKARRTVGTRRLMAYRRLAFKHEFCEERLAELRRRPRLTEEDQIEESKLKKLKLMIKDEMELLRSRLQR